jgi:hypothetical protein
MIYQWQRVYCMSCGTPEVVDVNDFEVLWPDEYICGTLA